MGPVHSAPAAVSSPQTWPLPPWCGAFHAAQAALLCPVLRMTYVCAGHCDHSHALPTRCPHSQLGVSYAELGGGSLLRLRVTLEASPGEMSQVVSMRPPG